ncbi:MAG: hypothetical protein GY868_04350, partial [Deltaproteobacteria bacterium]|nr:hypothetical protein [Deltaproteobacteria bacterium]
GIDAGAIEKLQGITHRSNAGYNCPYPPGTFVKYNEAPSQLEMKGEAEPGCLITDISGFASLNAAGVDAAQAMEKCNRLGIDPTAAAKLNASDLDSLASGGNIDAPAPWPLEGAPDQAILGASTAFSTGVPPKGIFANQGEGPEWWLNRQAVAYILGIDPVIMLMAPEMTEEKLADIVATAAEMDDFSADDLKRAAAELIEKSNA